MQKRTAPYAVVMEPSLRELRYLVAVAEARTFTDAAIELHVSQAAVSRTVAALERRLGAALFHRTPRGAEPTDLGRALLPQTRRVVAEVDSLVALVGARHSILRLGYAWSALGRHTSTLLRRWAAEHPDRELRLVRHNSPTAGLEEGACDAAVLRVEPDPARYDSVLVGTERRLVVFADDDPEWSRRRSLTMAEIAGRTILVDPRTGTTRPELWPPELRPTHLRRTTDIEDWLDAIATGECVGTTAEATASHYPRPGIAYRRISDGPPIPVRLAWRRGDPPAGIEALVQLVSELYEAS